MNTGALRSIADGIAEASKNANPPRDDDYQVNGIWYCGRCNTAKQCEVELLGSKKTVFCLCKCKAEEKAQRELAEKAERRKRAYERMIADSLMDERSLGARFENAVINTDNEQNLAICKAYAEKFDKMYEINRGMLFMGEPGTGKTYAAACIANALMDKGIGCMMTSFVKLTNMINSEGTEEFIEKMVDVPLLIIDDLGAQRDTSYAKEQVYNAVNMRYEAEKPMIITTNLSLGRDMMDTDLECTRVFDRIFQCCIPITWSGKSWRTANISERIRDFKKELGF